jgi:hypothetical protein
MRFERAARQGGNARRARRRVVYAAVVATVLLASLSVPVLLASGGAKTSAGNFLTLVPPALKPASASRHRVRGELVLRLHGAVLTRSGGRIVLRGRPVGTGRMTRTANSRKLRAQRIKLRASWLATVMDGLAGSASVEVRLPGVGQLLLTAPHMRGGTLVASVSRRRPRPRKLGDVTLVARIMRSRLQVQGNCVILPFTPCANAELPLASLFRADLRGADLRGADLQRAWLHGADLAAADLRNSDLRGTDLVDADLRRANLRGADLADANLSFAAISRGALKGAHLCDTLVPGRRTRTMRDCREASPTRRIPVRRTWHAPTVARRASVPAPRNAGRRRLSQITPILRRSHRTRQRLPRLTGAPTRTLTPPSPPIRAPHDCLLRYVSSRYSNTLDSDGDGLTNCYEETPHTLTVITPADLATAVRKGQIPRGHKRTGITSDPYNADTDGDGVPDGVEVENAGDPSRPDTDGDGLGDRSELMTYGSFLNNADSDGDSVPPDGGQPNPSLFDGKEAKTFHTSPMNKDTDGDGLTDYHEIVNGNGVLNPVVANLPSFSVGVSPRTPHVTVSLPITTTTGSTKKTSAETGQVTTSEQTVSHEVSLELGLEFSQEFEFGTKVGVPSDEAEGKSTYGFKESVAAGTTTTWEDKSSLENEYKKIQEQENSQETEIGDKGCVQATVRLTNTSTVGFTLSGGQAGSAGGLQVLAELPDPANPNTAIVLATMQPVSGEPLSVGTCPGTQQTTVDLGPGESKDVTFAGEARTEDLLAFESDPKPITFEMGNYTITQDDNAAVPFSKIEENVETNDAAVVVDFGDHAPNGSDRVQQFEVAAGVKRTVAARPIGTTMDEALDELGLGPVYGGGNSGRAKLVGLDGVNNAPNPNKGLWTVVGSAQGIADDTVDFPDITLTPGKASNIFLTYMDDSDNDGVPNNNEGFNGTSPSAPDTDGDGLSDKFETQTGWTVPLPTSDGKHASYKVFSSPLSCDADGDGSPDGPGKGTQANPCPSGPAEYNRGGGSASAGFVGTDPKLPDSNFDGIPDGTEPFPQVLENLPPGNRAPVFNTQFGGNGGGGGTFNQPTAIAVDTFGPKQSTPSPETLWVADPNNRLIQSFSLDNLTHGVDVSNPPGGSPGPYQGVAISPQTTSGGSSETNPVTGQVLWASFYNRNDNTSSSACNEAPGGCFQLFAQQANAANGQLSGGWVGGFTFLPYFGTNPIFTTNPQWLNPTSSVAVDRNGNVYLANAGNASTVADLAITSVAEYTAPSGIYVRSFPGKSCLKSNTTVATNPVGVAVDAQGDVFVADNAYPYSWGVHKYSGQTGCQVASIKPDNLRAPAGLAVDGNGYVYVTAQRKAGNTGDVVYKFSNSLTYLTRFGGPDTAGQGGNGKGPGNGLFAAPVDVDSDANGPTGGNVYVLDQKYGVVEIFTYPFGEG